MEYSAEVGANLPRSSYQIALAPNLRSITQGGLAEKLRLNASK